MAFEFRLEKVLKYRNRVVEKHTRDVAVANRVVVGVAEKVQEVSREIDGLLESNLVEMSLTLDVETLIARGKWLAHLEDNLVEMEKELDQAQTELAHQRSLLTGAWRDMEVLERLRDKQKNLWIEEQRKQENKNLDEIGQIRADRRHRENVSPL